MDISKMNIKDFVVVNDNLEEIPLEIISLSKNLSKLKGKLDK